jgi:hypothetical protein
VSSNSPCVFPSQLCKTDNSLRACRRIAWGIWAHEWAPRAWVPDRVDCALASLALERHHGSPSRVGGWAKELKGVPRWPHQGGDMGTVAVELGNTGCGERGRQSHALCLREDRKCGIRVGAAEDSTPSRHPDFSVP